MVGRLFQFDLAARNLARHRTRTLISLAAIVFGVAGLMLASGFIEWIFWAMRNAAIETGVGHIQISRPGFQTGGLADPQAFLLAADPPELKQVRAMRGVRGVSERLLLSGLISTGELTIAFTGEAVDPDTDKTVRAELTVNGQDLAAADPGGLLLGRGLATALAAKQGDHVTLLVTLPGGGINAVDAHVRGTFETHVKAYDDSALRMTVAQARELTRVRGAHLWVVSLAATDQTDEVAGLLRSALPRDRFEIHTWLDLSDFYRKAVALLSRQIGALALLIGVIIVLGISNTLTMNVLERTGEIGTLMAIGTTRAGILRMFVLEGCLLGTTGGVAGIAIGWVLAQALSSIGIPMPPPPGRIESYSAEIMLTVPIVLLALTIAVASSTLASVYPAWKASRLPIIDALRHNR